MLDFQQKRKIKSVLYNKVTIGILFVILVAFVHSTWGVYQKKVESEGMLELSEQNTEVLRERQRELDMKIERLNNGEGIEEEIRSRFSVAKEGESMVVILEDVDNFEEKEAEKQNLWQKIKEFIVFW